MISCFNERENKISLCKNGDLKMHRCKCIGIGVDGPLHDHLKIRNLQLGSNIIRIFAIFNISFVRCSFGGKIVELLSTRIGPAYSLL